MQIVIDIPEEVYKNPFNYCCYALANDIKNGIPLPKGHGRLIDAKTYEQNIRKHYFDNDLVIRCTEIALDNTPTIIEADRRENE